MNTFNDQKSKREQSACLTFPKVHSHSHRLLSLCFEAIVTITVEPKQLPNGKITVDGEEIQCMEK
jgi:hypothetical protein